MMGFLAFYDSRNIQYHQYRSVWCQPPSSSSSFSQAKSSWLMSGISPDECHGNLCEGILCLKKGMKKVDVSKKLIFCSLTTMFANPTPTHLCFTPLLRDICAGLIKQFFSRQYWRFWFQPVFAGTPDPHRLCPGSPAPASSYHP